MFVVRGAPRGGWPGGGSGEFSRSSHARTSDSSLNTIYIFIMYIMWVMAVLVRSLYSPPRNTAPALSSRSSSSATFPSPPTQSVSEPRMRVRSGRMVQVLYIGNTIMYLLNK